MDSYAREIQKIAAEILFATEPHPVIKEVLVEMKSIISTFCVPITDQFLLIEFLYQSSLPHEPGLYFWQASQPP